MSVKYIPVQWGSNKYWYDAILLFAVVVYILIYLRIGVGDADVTRAPDGAILRMRAFGSCAFLMLTLILCIGPLARLDPRFLPLLYNRRHFGVITTAVAFTHAVYVLSWYFAFSPTPGIEALLTSNTDYDLFLGFPFEALGIFALFVLILLSATSHDFWLSFLSPPIWKGLHLAIYPAYAAAVAHVALGYLQDAKNPTFALVFMGGALAVAAVHLLAWRRAGPEPESVAAWVDVGAPEEIPEGRAKVIRLTGEERAAVFRIAGHLSAVSNACAHQGGPLGEGRVIDGCITCPWHGFQYRPEDGCSPAPFTEKIPTYDLKLEDGRVWLRREANPPGTHVPPLPIPAEQAA
ncbi:MAG: Rieske 2Fe-2S domain-containing protein [Pseudomonadota bacterium]